MSECLHCHKKFKFTVIGQESIQFCSKTCLDEYCEQYAQDNWKDIAYMMGARN